MIQQPFDLMIEPLPNASYALTVLQHPFQSVHAKQLPPVKVGSINGLPLSSAQDLVIETLRVNQHKPTALTPGKKKSLGLSEASGVRLSLLFKAIAPLSNLDHIRAVQQGIWAMSDEEAYYWFSKCTGANGNKGTRAIRVLFDSTL